MGGRRCLDGTVVHIPFPQRLATFIVGFVVLVVACAGLWNLVSGPGIAPTVCRDPFMLTQPRAPGEVKSVAASCREAILSECGDVQDGLEWPRAVSIDAARAWYSCHTKWRQRTAVDADLDSWLVVTGAGLDRQQIRAAVAPTP